MAEQVLIQFRTEAKNAFHELRRQPANVPEMSLDEINAEILAVRAERKKDDNITETTEENFHIFD